MALIKLRLVDGPLTFQDIDDNFNNLNLDKIERVLEVNDANDGLRITQTGSGNAFVVEDSANPDTTPFVIDNSGKLGLGTATPATALEVSDATSGGVIRVSGAVGAGLEFTDSNTKIITPAANELAIHTSGVEQVRIDDAGNVGIGTDTPVEKLDVDGSIGTFANLNFKGTQNRVTGDFSDATIANRTLLQSNVTNGASSVGVIPNGTGTSSYTVTYNNSNPTDASIMSFGVTSSLAQVISGITGTGTYLPMTFSTNNTERMRIDVAGDVGIGIADPVYKLHVDGQIYATGDITAFSDERLKENISTINNATELVEAMRGVYYTRKGTNKQSVGVIAQEMQKVLPQVVADASEYLGVSYGNIVGVLIEAIKEQNKKIKELEQKILDR